MAFLLKKRAGKKLNTFVNDIAKKGCRLCPLSVVEDFRFDPIGSDNPEFYVVLDKPVEQDFKLKKSYSSLYLLYDVSFVCV